MKQIGTIPLVTSFLTFIIIATIGLQPTLGQQTGTVTGIVTDGETGKPLPAVNISVEDTNIGVTTNAEGNFIINSVPAGNQQITFSFVGYKKVTKDIRVRPDETLACRLH